MYMKVDIENKLISVQGPLSESLPQEIINICTKNGYKWEIPNSIFYIIFEDSEVTNADKLLNGGLCQLEGKRKSFTGRNGIRYNFDTEKDVFFVNYENSIYNNLIMMTLYDDDDFNVSICSGIYYRDHSFISAAHCFIKSGINYNLSDINFIDEKLEPLPRFGVDAKNSIVSKNDKYFEKEAATHDYQVFKIRETIPDLVQRLTIEYDLDEIKKYQNLYLYGRRDKTKIKKIINPFFIKNEVQQLSADDKKILDQHMTKSMYYAKESGRYDYYWNTFRSRAMLVLFRGKENSAAKLAEVRKLMGNDALDKSFFDSRENMMNLLNAGWVPAPIYKLDGDETPMNPKLRTLLENICELYDYTISSTDEFTENQMDETFPINHPVEPGDSGGPIYLLNDLNQYRLIGVTSLGTSGNGCGVLLPKHLDKLIGGSHMNYLFSWPIFLIIAIILLYAYYFLIIKENKVTYRHLNANSPNYVS